MEAQRAEQRKTGITWQTHLIIALAVVVPVVITLASMMYITGFERQYFENNDCIKVPK